jgi:hypothetical protein
MEVAGMREGSGSAVAGMRSCSLAGMWSWSAQILAVELQEIEGKDARLGAVPCPGGLSGWC